MFKRKLPLLLSSFLDNPRARRTISITPSGDIVYGDVVLSLPMLLSAFGNTDLVGHSSFTTEMVLDAIANADLPASIKSLLFQMAICQDKQFVLNTTQQKTFDLIVANIQEHTLTI